MPGRWSPSGEARWPWWRLECPPSSAASRGWSRRSSLARRRCSRTWIGWAVRSDGRRCWSSRWSSAVGLVTRPAGHRHAGLRHRPGRGRRSRGAAGRGHHLPRDRRAPHGEAQRAGATAAGRRDPGQHVGDLLGQDRHADQERNDGPAGVRGPASRRRVGHRLHAGGQFLEAGRDVPPSPAVMDLLRAAALVSDAQLVGDGGHWRIEGDPTEAALLVAATKAGLDSSGDQPGRTPLERDPLHVGTAADDDPAPLPGRRDGGLLQRGRRPAARELRSHRLRRRRSAVDRRRGRTRPADRTGDGGRGPPGSRRRPKVARLGRGCRAPHDAPGPGRHHGSAAARGGGRRANLRLGRHPADHDHRRPPADRGHDRARDRHAGGTARDVRAGSRLDERRRLRTGGRADRCLRTGDPGTETARGRSLAAARGRGGDDRRRRQRRAGA